jgi:AraC-like DNA-binding protein
MLSVPLGNDGDTRTVDRDATNASALDAALSRLTLDGAIYFRAEFTEAWAYESPPAEIAHLLRPGAERLIMFHIVALGRCCIALDDGQRYWAEAGDVIVLPYGDQHWMGGTTPAQSVPIVTLLDPLPWASPPVLRYGAGGDRTDIVCGYLHSEDPLFDPRLAAFPRVFVVRPPEGPLAQWVQSSIEYALAVTSAPPGSHPAPTRLPELLAIEVIRLHLASAPAARTGWIAALRDPVLAPALAELHLDPARRWTVADLASRAAVSRSLLDERFRVVLGRSPIRYLAEWRMHLADELLASTELTVAEVGFRVGYDSEEAFSRAFKRHRTVSPSLWRLRRRVQPTAS